MKYNDFTLGQIEAVFNKLGGGDGVFRFLRDELTVSEPVRRWREQDSIVYFLVTSDGATGPEWIDRLEKKGFRVGDYAKRVLRSADFKPTNGVTTEIAVLKGELFPDSDRITEKIRAEAGRRNFTKPNAEVACLIRDKFSDEEIKEMGLLWVIVMHEPIKDSGGFPGLLSARRSGAGYWLYAFYVSPGDGWDRGGGFTFAVSQVSLN